MFELVGRSKRYVAESLLLALCAFIVACGGYFAPDRNIRERLDESELSGAWQLTARSLELLERDGFHRNPDSRYRLTLTADGECQFESVVDDFKGGTDVRAPCTWRLEHDAADDSSIKRANILRVSFRPDGRVLHFSFARQGGELILWNYYGDPDSWEFIEYSRAHRSTSFRPLQPTRRREMNWSKQS
jgi:hypothetical protein